MDYETNASAAKVESSTDGEGPLDVCFTNSMGSLTSDAKSDGVNEMKKSDSDNRV